MVVVCVVVVVVVVVVVCGGGGGEEKGRMDGMAGWLAGFAQTGCGWLRLAGSGWLDGWL